ncbi:MAG: pyridoxamine 5'-phosphate oxidase family protein [Gammaproteobacteria bacterium]|nr:pyridoxamine 5'-phosphate oxidase family protein [Gammaproteobacteria bacterium]
MINKKSLFETIAALTIGALLCAGSLQAGSHEEEQQEGVDFGFEPMTMEGIVAGPPLKGDEVKSANHPPYQQGMTCGECHEVSYDGMTSATRQSVNNSPSLSQDEIWDRIVAFVPGAQTFALATVVDDEPLATPVDMVLDQDEKVFIVLSETGTEKLGHLRDNPSISAVRYISWKADSGQMRWRSAQLRGTAELIEGTDPRYAGYFQKYNPVGITLERSALRLNVIKVTPQEIMYMDTEPNAEGVGVYQLWRRAD